MNPSIMAHPESNFDTPKIISSFLSYPFAVSTVMICTKIETCFPYVVQVKTNRGKDPNNVIPLFETKLWIIGAFAPKDKLGQRPQ